jgi:CO/xanthine dehydrogenase Mo-binding subunit
MNLAIDVVLHAGSCLVINPDGLVNQIEGGIVQSISWTLLEEVKWDRQQVLTRSWGRLSHPAVPRGADDRSGGDRCS